jgi:hypothetical protein
MLAGMNWRRGLVLVATNLVVAAPLLLVLDSRDAAWTRQRGEIVRKDKPVIASSTLGTSQVADAGGSAFNPCFMTDRFSIEEEVVLAANLPAFALSGWRNACPPVTPAAQRTSDAILLLLIGIQWFLLGAFPMHGPRGWREPGMFITVCSALSMFLLLIGPLRQLAQLSGMIALLTWFCWMLWFLQRAVLRAWRLAARSLASSNVSS